MARAFYEWSGGTEQDHAALAWFSQAGVQHMGPMVASFRGGIAPRAWGKALGLLVVVCLLLSLLVLALGPAGRRGVVVTLALVCLITTTIYLLVMIAVALLARRYRHDVHAHGLVVWGLRGRAEVIPWASTDPGRVFVAGSVRSMTRMPVALHRQRAVLPPGVVMNGWTSRPTGSSELAEAFSSGYRYQPMPTDSPFGWWQLGVTDPAAFLSSVESAMVADGYPAVGLAPFALARRFTAGDLRRDPSLQQERLLTDRVIGLPGTSPPP